MLEIFTFTPRDYLNPIHAIENSFYAETSAKLRTSVNFDSPRNLTTSASQSHRRARIFIEFST